MTTSVLSKFVRAAVLIGILTGSAMSPAIARDSGGGGDGPRPSGLVNPDCALHKKLEKHETRVTALQFEYRSLSEDLEKAKKGSKEAAKLQRKIDKVGKKLSRERDKAADYFRQVSERQFNGIGC